MIFSTIAHLKFNTVEDFPKRFFDKSMTKICLISSKNKMHLDLNADKIISNNIKMHLQCHLKNRMFAFLETFENLYLTWFIFIPA